MTRKRQKERRRSRVGDYIATYYNPDKIAKAWSVIQADFLRETGVTL